MSEPLGARGKEGNSNLRESDSSRDLGPQKSSHSNEDVPENKNIDSYAGTDATVKSQATLPKRTTILSPAGSKKGLSKRERQKVTLTEDEKAALDELVSKMELRLVLGTSKYQAIYRGTPRHSPEPIDLFAEFGSAVNTSNEVDNEWQDVPLSEPGWWFFLHPNPTTPAINPLSTRATPVCAFSVDDIANFMNVRYMSEKNGKVARRRAPRMAPCNGDLSCSLIYRTEPLPESLVIPPPTPLSSAYRRFVSKKGEEKEDDEYAYTSEVTNDHLSRSNSFKTTSSSLLEGLSTPLPNFEDIELAQAAFTLSALYESDSDVETTEVDVMPIQRKHWTAAAKTALSKPRTPAKLPSYKQCLEHDAKHSPITLYDLPLSSFKIKPNPPLPSARRKILSKDGSRLAGLPIRTVYHADRTLFEEQTDHLLILLRGAMVEGVILHIPFDSLPENFRAVAGRVAYGLADLHRSRPSMFRPEPEIFYINRFAPPKQRLNDGDDDPYDSEHLYPEQMSRHELRLELLKLEFTDTAGVPSSELRKKLRDMKGLERNDELDDANLPFRPKKALPPPDDSQPRSPSPDELPSFLDGFEEEDEGSIDTEAQEDLTDLDDLLEEESEEESDDSDDDDIIPPPPRYRGSPKPKRKRSDEEDDDDEDEFSSSKKKIVLPPLALPPNNGVSRNLFGTNNGEHQNGDIDEAISDSLRSLADAFKKSPSSGASNDMSGIESDIKEEDGYDGARNSRKAKRRLHDMGYLDMGSVDMNAPRQQRSSSHATRSAIAKLMKPVGSAGDQPETSGIPPHFKGPMYGATGSADTGPNYAGAYSRSSMMSNAQTRRMDVDAREPENAKPRGRRSSASFNHSGPQVEDVTIPHAPVPLTEPVKPKRGRPRLVPLPPPEVSVPEAANPHEYALSASQKANRAKKSGNSGVGMAQTPPQQQHHRLFSSSTGAKITTQMAPIVPTSANLGVNFNNAALAAAAAAASPFTADLALAAASMPAFQNPLLTGMAIPTAHLDLSTLPLMLAPTLGIPGLSPFSMPGLNFALSPFSAIGMQYLHPQFAPHHVSTTPIIEDITSSSPDVRTSDK